MHVYIYSDGLSLKAVLYILAVTKVVTKNSFNDNLDIRIVEFIYIYLYILYVC